MGTRMLTRMLTQSIVIGLTLAPYLLLGQHPHTRQVIHPRHMQGPRVIVLILDMLQAADTPPVIPRSNPKSLQYTVRHLA